MEGKNHLSLFNQNKTDILQIMKHFRIPKFEKII